MNTAFPPWVVVRDVPHADEQRARKIPACAALRAKAPGEESLTGTSLRICSELLQRQYSRAHVHRKLSHPLDKAAATPVQSSMMFS
jgi:hypothetical protein